MKIKTLPIIYLFLFLISSMSARALVQTVDLLAIKSLKAPIKVLKDYSLFQNKYLVTSSAYSEPISITKIRDNYLQHSTNNHYSILEKRTFSINNTIPSPSNKSIMITNRRLKYSSLWAFASLNYLYADLVGIMDLNLLSQYQTGVVNGIEITPGFLTVAAAYMQIPLANVFLPHIIKNDNVLRWIQVISGSIATLAQGATLFVGTPAPYYILFTAIEMSATSYITFDAIKWKTKKGKNKKSLMF